MPEKKIDVTAYSGSRGEELPRSFVLGDDRIEVVQIIDMWIEEGLEGRSRKRFFKIKGGDGYTHKIYYDEASGEWFLQA